LWEGISPYKGSVAEKSLHVFENICMLDPIQSRATSLVSEAQRNLERPN